MTLILSGTDGLSDVDGSAATPAIRGTDANTGIFFPAADTIAFSEGGTEAMRIDSSGNVGIGTSSPGERLRVQNTTGVNTTFTNSVDADVKINLTSGVALISPSTGVLALGTSSTERMRIDSSGNVGIGTASPISKLHVNSSGSTATYAIVGNSNGGSIFGVDASGLTYVAGYASKTTLFGSYNSGGAFQESARIDSSGYSRWSDTGSYSYSGTAHSVNNSASNDIIRFFSSNATPYGLFVKFTAADPNNASNYVFAAEQNTGVNIYKIYSNGTVAARSDARWKKNIETARDGYLADLNQLRVVKYNWYNNEDGTAKELGLIAQEVETVFPNMVVTDNVGEENESKSIKTSVLPFMLLKAIQEQQAIITQLQADVASLKGTP